MSQSATVHEFLIEVGRSPSGRPALASFWAPTKSEARALAKKDLGIPRKGRLPLGSRVTRTGRKPYRSPWPPVA